MALSADRNTPRRAGDQFEYPVAASALIYAGALVALDTSGNAEPASLATGKIICGVAEEAADNSDGSAGDIKVKVRAGVFGMLKQGTVDKTSIGDVVYAYDDQTVQTSSSGASPVGVLVDVDGSIAYVLVAGPKAAPSTGLLAANNLSDIGTAATAAHNLGLGTADSPTFAGLTLTGAVAGTTGAFTGILTGLHKTAVKTTAYTILNGTDADALLQSATDNEVFTLPDIAAGNAGQLVRIQNTAADGAAKISISPHSSDKIKGQVGSVEFSGTADKDAINTKATQKQGDFLALQNDGVDTWWVVGGIGVWASES